MEIGELVAVDVDTSSDKFLRAGLTEVTFKSPVKVAVGQASVQPPHWCLGTVIADGPYSKRPAVYLVHGKGGSQDVNVKVKITEARNVSGTGTLTGIVDQIQIEGQCPLSVGEHTIAARISALPEGIAWIRGDVTWGLDVPALGACLALNSTRVELFFVLGTPTDVYQQGRGVWAEALRFLCGRVGVSGMTDATEVVATITRYCHTSHRLKYDSAGGGGSSYGVGARGGSFQLEMYLQRAEEFANCYDQAAAVQALAGCVGPRVDWVFMNPYGFINRTALLGYGACNNPFFLMNGSPQVIAQNDPRRTPFGNHAFCAFAGKVRDACGGPHIGTEGYGEYVAASIDAETSLYSDYHGLRAGNALDMQWCAGVTSVG